MSKQQNVLQTESHTETVRPLSGFRVSNLFEGGNSPISLGEEMRREIASANQICLIVSFLKVSGVRIFTNDLRKFSQKEGSLLRIITTTYCGATQAKAIEQLAALPNTEIRISYNTDIERLHAKSYIFVRNSACTRHISAHLISQVGSNRRFGMEHACKRVENPHIIKTALATFEMYWNSPNFEDFSIGGIEKFNKEIHLNLFKENAEKIIYQHYALLPHQKQILDKLRVEREEMHNFRNLVVAATVQEKQ
jgi:HKD family nuclease